MHVWSPSWNMPSDNLILFEADIRPYGSRKLKDGRSKQSSERKARKGGGRMVKTHFGNLASPPLLLWIPTGSNEGGFAEVNHFLQVVNSQGRQDESGVCSDQAEASQQHFGRQSCCFSLTLVLKCWENFSLWSPDKADSSHSPWRPLTLNEVIYAGDVDDVAVWDETNWRRKIPLDPL